MKHLPQLLFVALIVFGDMIHLIRNGEPRDDRYNVWISLLGTAITVSLLYWGGFFDGLIKALS